MKNHRTIVGFVSVLILALMCAPVALAASPAAVSPPVGGSSLLGLAGLFALGTLATTEKKEGDVPDVATAIAQIEDKGLPIGQRLSVALAALRGVDPTGQLANVKGEYDRAMADLKTANEEKDKLAAELADLKKQLAAREKDVEAADTARAEAEKKVQTLEAAEKDLDKRAEAKAKERLGAVGFPSSKAPTASDKAGAGDTLDDLRAQFKAECDPLKKARLARQIRVLEEKAAA
ncbi:MAG: hypothetical protein JNJ83_11000 [Verrucomicrobiaceae bacterium]|nr:hypothetical protein [Verrucomicrobiaceae bacterium]